MAETTIEWTRGPNGEKGFSFNPWVGCAQVGPGCDHCYAEGWAKRSGLVQWGAGAERRRTSEANWKQPLRWNAEAERLGIRYRVFCASLADVFDNEVPAEWRADLFDLIARTPNLDWLLVTKRIGNVGRMVEAATCMTHLPGNVWLGITVVNQAEADRDIPKLLKIPAAVRFLSMEPLLGPVSLKWMELCSGCEAVRIDWGRDNNRCGYCGVDKWRSVDWVIVGGESGPSARPMHPQWARDSRDQCEAAGVPFLFKQWGEWLPGENETHAPTGRKVAHHQDGRWGATDTKVSARNYVVWDESGDIHRGSLIDAPFTLRVVAWAERVGKKSAGRLLDGREHNGFPGGAR